MALISSTISFLFLLVLTIPLIAEASTGRSAKLSASLLIKVVWSTAGVAGTSSGTGAGVEISAPAVAAPGATYRSRKK